MKWGRKARMSGGGVGGGVGGAKVHRAVCMQRVGEEWGGNQVPSIRVWDKDPGFKGCRGGHQHLRVSSMKWGGRRKTGRGGEGVIVP